MIKQIDHIGIVVRDIEDSLKLYRDVYGLRVAAVETYPEVQASIAFLPLGEVLLELIQPLEPGVGPIGEFLEEHGEGFHHLALRVDDIDRDMQELTRARVSLLDDKAREGGLGAMIAFLDSKGTQNVLTELVERKQEPFGD